MAAASASAIDTEINLSAFAQGAPELVRLGFSPIRIRNGEKRPFGQAWQAYCRAPATAYEIAEWSRGCFGIGIACGTLIGANQVVAIDVDLEGDELEQALAALPPSPMEKFGRKGLTRFYLCGPGFGSRKYTRARLDGGRGAETMVDFQADGKQVVAPPTIHPDTGRSYIWQRGPVPARDLPVLTSSDIERFEDTLRHLRWDEANATASRTVARADAEEDGSVWREVNACALANLDWAIDPALSGSLYGARRVGDRVEAVPLWREGGTGNPLAQRKRSLKLHATGIRDYGTGEGYSPLGLVHRALGGTFDDAFRWLGDRIGYLADTDIPPAVLDELAANAARRQREREADRLAALSANDNAPAVVAPRLITATPFVLRPASELPRREWLFGTFAIRKEIALTVAPGGVGKTALSLAEAVSMATGRNLLDTAVTRPLSVWVWNGEEPADEMERRLGAICLKHGITAEDLAGRLYVDTEDSVELVLAEENRHGCIIRHPVVNALIDELKRRQIDVMIVDPFVSTHNVTENDNKSMQLAASAWKQVAKGANVAIMLAHHARKANGQQVTSDSSRGGDSFVSKARSVRTLNTMTKEEAAAFHVPVAERRCLFSIDPGLGKVNMVAHGGAKQWYRNVSVPLYNRIRGNIDVGDEVGVVMHWTPPDPTMSDLEDESVAFLQRKLANGFWYASPQSHNKPDWVGCAIAEAFNVDTADAAWKAKVKAIWRQLLEAEDVRETTEKDPQRRHDVKVARPPEGWRMAEN